MNKKLTLKLYKNNNLVIDKQDITYNMIENKITFTIDNTDNTIYLLKEELILERSTEEYHFSLNINSQQNSCQYYLKELDSTFDILVEDATYSKKDNLIDIYYQIETDDETTHIEITLAKEV